MDIFGKKKKVVKVVSHGTYRGVTIYEDGNGYSIVIRARQYDFDTLGEATACIDAMLINVLSATREMNQIGSTH